MDIDGYILLNGIFWYAKCFFESENEPYFPCFGDAIKFGKKSGKKLVKSCSFVYFSVLFFQWKKKS